MQTRRAAFLLFAAGAAAAAANANAQPTQPSQAAPPPRAPAPGQIVLPYGAPITLEQARRIMAGAHAEAGRNRLLMAFAIVDPAGELVMFERMEGVQYASIEVAQAKARSAARFRRPTRYWDEAINSGRVGVMTLGDGVVASEGGLPIVDTQGRVIGALGVSGGTAAQDGQVADAALRALR